MLANVLPGIRELRTPLAAGAIWLLGWWLLFEPAWSASPTSPLLASLGRLSGFVAVVGLGVVVSFVAYLVGSLSSSVLPWPPRRANFGWLTRISDHLSREGRGALLFVAEAARARLDEKLSISGTALADLLEKENLTSSRSDGKIASVSSPGRFRSGLHRLEAVLRGDSVYRPRIEPVTPMTGNLPPRDLDTEQRNQIAAGIERDLSSLAIIRLLGRDDELYSTVDRFTSESDFRGAIVPPLAFLGLVVGANAGSAKWWVFLGTGVVCLVLTRDAYVLRRRSNDILVDVLADGRIGCPTLDRLDAAAEAAGLEGRATEARREASSIASALRQALTALEEVGRSEASLAKDALEKARLATGVVERADASPLSEEVRQAAWHVARSSLELAEDWSAVIEGRGPIPDQEKRNADLRDSYEAYIQQAKSEIAALREDKSATG